MNEEGKVVEFEEWRTKNLWFGIVGVAAVLWGAWKLLFSGDSYGTTVVIVGAFWYLFFYLRYVAKRGWYESDRFEALREEYHELIGINRALVAERGEKAQGDKIHAQRIERLKFQMEEVLRRNVRRDINIATLLTRRFAVSVLNRYATQYRHELVNPILSLLRDGVIREAVVIALLEEPEAFADLVHDRREELEATCPKLIELCKDKWPPPESESA